MDYDFYQTEILEVAQIAVDYPKWLARLTYPSFRLLMSRFDKAVDHHRRYAKKTERELLTDNGFEIVTTYYVNSVGWFVWLIGIRILKITRRDSLVLKIWDKIVIPVVSKFESWISPLFGQNILIVSQKSIKG